MAEYIQARNKKKQQIINAFWELYKRNNYQNVMGVKEITDFAKINRSTFYFYYQNTQEILEEIIENLKSKIVVTFSSQKRILGNYHEFYVELNSLFKKYRKYLVPLVCESKHPDFAAWYRNNQRERFKEDIGLAHNRMDKRKNQIINIALSGIIEEQIQTLAYGQLSIDDSFNLELGMLHDGLLKTLKDKFSILRK